MAGPQGPLSRESLLARNRFMSDVVFPGIATRTSTYAQSLYDGFAKRNHILSDDYLPGALVMRKVNVRSSKMAPSWEGPFFVIRRSRGGTYFLRDPLSN